MVMDLVNPLKRNLKLLLPKVKTLAKSYQPTIKENLLFRNINLINHHNKIKSQKGDFYFLLRYRSQSMKER